MHLKKNDMVKVICGDDRGKQGKIIRIVPETGKAIVQGINMHWKHVKRGKEYPHGARIQKELPVNSANLMLVCPNCNKPTRISYQFSETGVKNRTCKKCNKPVYQE